jgi:transposase-like protein
MGRYRSYSTEFKRQVALEFLGGETFHNLSRRHGISRTLIKIWVAKHEAGEFDDEQVSAALLAEYEARIAALERKVVNSRWRTTCSKKRRGYDHRAPTCPL